MGFQSKLSKRVVFVLLTLFPPVFQIVEMDRGIQHGVLAREWVEPDLSSLSDLCPALSPSDTPALAAVSRILAPSSGEEGALAWYAV